MIDSIEDESTLQMLMEDIALYTSGTDIIDELSAQQLKDLEEAMAEMDNNEGIGWNEFKQQMKGWMKK